MSSDFRTIRDADPSDAFADLRGDVEATARPVGTIAAKMGKAEASLDILRDHLNGLETLIASLEAELAPVLTPGGGDGVSDGRATEGEKDSPHRPSPLAERIESHVERIESATRAAAEIGTSINRLRSRLEV